MKWFRDYEELLNIRYKRLYGEIDCNQFIRHEKKFLIAKFTALIVIVSLIIVNDVSVNRNVYSNIEFGRNGEITGVTRPDNGEESYSFSTDVTIISDEGEKEKEYYITIEPAGDDEAKETPNVFGQQAEEQTAENELKKLISALNEDTSEETVELPEKLENGDRLVWTVAEDRDPLIYSVILLILIWLLYRSRFSRIRQEEKKARESVLRELPEFINKLVLLLNAGVVLNTAFLKIVEDVTKQKTKKSYFYRRITDIANMVNETNASFHQELYTFARHSGVKELMRIANIMMDNISKGDDLADKLRRENELLWFVRKQQAEEKGRLAETKMTMPLMILLLVLIMVSTAPALMEI